MSFLNIGDESIDRLPTPAKLGCHCAASLVTIALLALLAAVGWFIFSACTGESEPPFYACSYEAKQAVKRNLTFPSTFDEHDMLTFSKGDDLSIISRVGDKGWNIRTMMVFGSKNAFGVQSDYLVWYDGRADEDGNCTGVILDDFIPYVR